MGQPTDLQMEKWWEAKKVALMVHSSALWSVHQMGLMSEQQTADPTDFPKALTSVHPLAGLSAFPLARSMARNLVDSKVDTTVLLMDCSRDMMTAHT